jgi:hypothetical protein
LSRTNLNVLSREHGGVTRLFDRFPSEKLNRRHKGCARITVATISPLTRPLVAVSNPFLAAV